MLVAGALPPGAEGLTHHPPKGQVLSVLCSAALPLGCPNSGGELERTPYSAGAPPLVPSRGREAADLRMD